MQLLYDNLIVGIIAAVVVAMLIQGHFRTQRANIEAAQYYANRVQGLGVIHTVEQDLRNIGAGVEQDDPVFFSWTVEGDTLTRAFSFSTVIDSTADAPMVRVNYQLVNATNTVCDTSITPCYQLKRYVDAGAGYTESGGSTDTITGFDIDLQDRQGNTVGAHWEDARQIFVKMTSASPLGTVSDAGSGYVAAVPEMTWAKRIRPPNLLLRDQ